MGEQELKCKNRYIKAFHKVTLLSGVVAGPIYMRRQKLKPTASVTGVARKGVGAGGVAKGRGKGPPNRNFLPKGRKTTTHECRHLLILTN